MSEIKSLYVAVLATLLMMGAIFGISAIVRRGATAAAADEAAVAGAPTPTATTESAAALPAGIPSAAPTAAAAAGPAPDGKALYAEQCASCHGDSGEGGYGPNLQKRIRTVDAIAAVVAKGVPDKMPGLKGKLTEAEIRAVSEYAAAMGGH